MEIQDYGMEECIFGEEVKVDGIEMDFLDIEINVFDTKNKRLQYKIKPE